MEVKGEGITLRGNNSRYAGTTNESDVYYRSQDDLSGGQTVRERVPVGGTSSQFCVHVIVQATE